MSARLKLADGSSWPAPDYGDEDHDSLGWRLRYQADTLTRVEQLTIAEIVSSYNYLFEPSMTAKSMGQKVAMLRRAFRERTTADAEEES